MNNDPILSRLGFARKANKTAFGFAKSKEALKQQKAKLIVVASDISQKSEKEIRFFAGDAVPVVRIDSTIEQLSNAVGFKAGIVAVNDEGFAKAILEQI